MWEGAHELNIPERDIKPPDEKEIEEAIESLKNQKAPWPDGLPAEVFMYGMTEIMKCFHNLILDIWEQEELPKEWCRSSIFPIHKNGGHPGVQ